MDKPRVTDNLDRHKYAVREWSRRIVGVVFALQRNGYSLANPDYFEAEVERIYNDGASDARFRITELEAALEALYEAGYWVLVDGPRTPNPIPTTETQTDLWQRAKDALRDSSPERGPE